MADDPQQAFRKIMVDLERQGAKPPIALYVERDLFRKICKSFAVSPTGTGALVVQGTKGDCHIKPWDFVKIA